MDIAGDPATFYLNFARWLGFERERACAIRRYGRRRILVTDGHEAEARAAQLRKRPNRVGLFCLRVLGFRKEVTPPTRQRVHARPSHMHRIRHEHSAPGSSSSDNSLAWFGCRFGPHDEFEMGLHETLGVRSRISPRAAE